MLWEFLIIWEFRRVYKGFVYRVLKGFLVWTCLWVVNERLLGDIPANVGLQWKQPAPPWTSSINTDISVTLFAGTFCKRNPGTTGQHHQTRRDCKLSPSLTKKRSIIVPKASAVIFWHMTPHPCLTYELQHKLQKALWILKQTSSLKLGSPGENCEKAINP